MIMKFKGKNAIVTGGTRGIGKTICDSLWQLGCNVIATGTSVDLRTLGGIKKKYPVGHNGRK